MDVLRRGFLSDYGRFHYTVELTLNMQHCSRGDTCSSFLYQKLSNTADRSNRTIFCHVHRCKYLVQVYWTSVTLLTEVQSQWLFGKQLERYMRVIGCHSYCKWHWNILYWRHTSCWYIFAIWHGKFELALYVEGTWINGYLEHWCSVY